MGGGRMNSAQGRSDANDYLEKRRELERNATGIPIGRREGSEHFNCGRGGAGGWTDMEEKRH